jgi:hypothetical protein
MADTITVTINGQLQSVPEKCTVAAAVVCAGQSSFRQSVKGQARGPLCGMGICFECRVTINGVAHQRSCQILCRAGMSIATDG